MAETTNRPRWPWLVAACIGAALLSVSFLWSILFPATGHWRPEKAKEYTDAGARLHGLISQRAGAGNDPNTRDEDLKRLEALRKEQHDAQLQWEALREELEIAKKRGNVTQSILRWGGAALTVLGLVGWLASRGPI